MLDGVDYMCAMLAPMESTPSNMRVAAALGVNHSTISRLRSGERRPGRDMLARIRDLYKLEPAEYVELIDAANGPMETCASAMRQVFTRVPGGESR